MRWVDVSVLLLCFTLRTQIRALDVYVSVKGDDANSGIELTKPFRTLEKARAFVRQNKASKTDPITVHVLAGRYELEDTLVFGPEDSGTAVAPITYQAYCNETKRQLLTNVMNYPFKAKSLNDLRYMWNGVGNEAAWTKPFDPLLPRPPAIEITPFATHRNRFCIDRVNAGKSCYADEIASCFHQCATSCHADVDKKVYSQLFYKHFYYLFGKDLRRRENCIEICARSCTGCDDAIITSFKKLPKTWKLHKTVTVSLNITANTSVSHDMHVLDLSATFSPNVPIDELYVDRVRWHRARYPNYDAANPKVNGKGYLNASSGTATSIVFKPSAVATNLSRWTKVNEARLVLYPLDNDKPANVIYRIQKVDAKASSIYFESEGAQLNEEIYFNGPKISSASRFMVENIFEELDSPGEWYYDVSTRKLYIIAPKGMDLSLYDIEVPMLRQLVKVQGSRETSYVYPDTGIAILHEEKDDLSVEYLNFERLHFMGTKATHMDTYERPSGSEWTITRSAALYMESVQHINIRYCTMEKLLGNAFLVYGRASHVQFMNNDVHEIGLNPISIISRRAYRINSFREPVFSRLLFSTNANVSYNRVFAFGQIIEQAGAISLVGNRQTEVIGNLIHHLPSAGITYFIRNADGGSSSTQLLRPLNRVTIPSIVAPTLGGFYTTVVPITGFDTKLIIKIVGAADCAPGTGRIEAIYGNYHAGCSGCCSSTAASAKIRKHTTTSAMVDWTKAHTWVEISPGESIELQVQASNVYDTPVDVHLRFHRVTVNDIIDLYGSIWYAKWTVITRPCTFSTSSYSVSCGGPCGCGDDAEQLDKKGPTCKSGDELNVTATTCTGPFEAWSDCRSGVAFNRVLFYNCTSVCTTSACT